MKAALGLVLATVATASRELGCTAILVAPGATVDGSSITTHNADCLDCDFRLARTSARNHKAGSPKAVLKYVGQYPHWVSQDRSLVWNPANLQGTDEQKSQWSTEEFVKSRVVGFLPEVEHTYAMVEGLFGIMNEKGVGIGESTCGAALFGRPARACPTCEGPLVDVSFLTVVALERCASARCVVEMIGNLAEELGYYAAEPNQAEGGEGLTIADGEEAWMFHILPDTEGMGAIWAAQRLPNDHIAACANAFVIRHIDPQSPDFLFSSNVWSEAEKNGFWSKADGLLDFAAAYGHPTAHPTYSTRRQWRVLSMAAPSLNLPSETNWLGDVNTPGDGLQMSVKVDKPISVRDVFAMKRDVYEGTQYDLTKGLQGGPYGNPARYDASVNTSVNENGVTQEYINAGTYERAISMFRTSYSVVSQSRKASPAGDITKAIVWASQYAPHAGVYTPIYVNAGETALPECFSIGSLFKFDTTSSFWRFASVGNWLANYFKYAIHDVRAVQQELEDRVFKEQESVEAAAKALLEMGNTEAAQSAVRGLSHAHADRFMERYTSLFYELLTRYHDGYRLKSTSSSAIQLDKLFYPKWWLDATGFPGGGTPSSPPAQAAVVQPLEAVAAGAGEAAAAGGPTWGFLILSNIIVAVAVAGVAFGWSAQSITKAAASATSTRMSRGYSSIDDL